jgi:L-lactate dehydrogenase
MKVSVVGGAGRVGSTTLFQLVREGWVDELGVVDVVSERAEGEMLDLLHGTSLARRIQFSGPGYEATAGSDMIVVTAGIPRKPGETRLDLLRKNVDLMSGVLEELGKRNRDYFLIMVANPVDVLTYQAIRNSGLPVDRVIGTGTLLDTVRFRSLLGDRLGVAPDQVYVYMLGEHGDSQAPCASGGSVAGVPLREYPGFSEAMLNEVIEATRYGGAEVIKRKGGTFYAVAPMIVELLRAIAFNQQRVLPVSTLMDGHLGMSNVALSLPTVIGKNGRERVIVPPLAQSESDALKNSYTVLREAVESVGL